MSAVSVKRAEELYQLGLGDILHDFGSDRVTVMAVPGGWIFTYHFNMATSVFVPYNDEYMPTQMKNAQ